MSTDDCSLGLTTKACEYRRGVGMQSFMCTESQWKASGFQGLHNKDCLTSPEIL